MQRQKATARCVKSRQTPTRSLKASSAVRVLSALLVVERDVAMDVVADRLNAVPARRRLPEEVPRRLRQPVGVAVPAAEQEDQRLLGQVLHRNLLRLRQR